MLDQINSLSEIHIYLPAIIKLTLLFFAIIISLFPLSIISFGYVYLFSSQVLKINEFFEKISEKLKKYSNKLIKKSNLLNKKYQLNLTASSTYKATVQETVGARDFKNLKEKIENQLSIIPQNERSNVLDLNDSSSDANQLIGNLNKELNRLENLKNDFEKDEFAIPNAKINEEDYIIKREGYANLIFIPLLISVMILNTYLLNLFFSDMVADNNNIFGYSFPIKLSHLISFLFTIVEAGIGVHFARFESFKSHENMIGKSVNAFAWSVLALLIFIEFFIYLKLSIENNSGKFLPEFFNSNPSFIEIIYNSWLSAFGPAIVFGLFIFGHQSTMAYFKIMKSSDLESLNKELNRADAQVLNISKSIENINESLKKLKKNNIEINQSSEKNIKNDEKNSKILEINLKDIISNLKHILKVLEKGIKNFPNDIRPVDIKEEKLSNVNQKSFYALDLIKGISLLVLFVAMTYSVRNLFSSNFGLINITLTQCIFYGISASLFLMICGHFFNQSSNLIINNEFYFLRSSVADKIKKIISLVFFLSFIFSFLMLIYFYPLTKNISMICIILSCGIFLMSFHARISLFALLNFTYHLNLKILKILIDLLDLILFMINLSLKFINGLFSSLARPWIKTFAKIN